MYFQAYTSVGKAGVNLRDHRELAKHINTVIFHTKMVDYLDEMLVETSDLSIYWSVSGGIAFYLSVFNVTIHVTLLQSVASVN